MSVEDATSKTSGSVNRARTVPARRPIRAEAADARDVGRLGSYRYSHMAAWKGLCYHATFGESAWLNFCTRCELSLLDRVVRRRLSGRFRRHLDFGCGTGRILAGFVDRTDESVGVDISEGMLSVAAEEIPRARFVNADLTHDDVLGDERFDLITAFRFFANAEPGLRRAAMAALAGHLAHDGLLVFNNHQNKSSIYYLAGRLIGKSWEWTPMSLREMRELVDEAGLEVCDTFGIGVLPGAIRFMVMPGFVHRAIDRLAHVLGLGDILAQDVVFVCRKRRD
jgi:SAM-dependent methyltransferase